MAETGKCACTPQLDRTLRRRQEQAAIAGQGYSANARPVAVCIDAIVLLTAIFLDAPDLEQRKAAFKDWS